MPEIWPGFDGLICTRACIHDAHLDCAHLITTGGGFNPRRLRLEFDASLCGCPCHTPCPVTIPARRMTVPWQTWYTSCTCPGAEQERQRLDEAGVKFPNFGELREEGKRRSGHAKAPPRRLSVSCGRKG